MPLFRREPMTKKQAQAMMRRGGKMGGPSTHAEQARRNARWATIWAVISVTMAVIAIILVIIAQT